MITLHTNKFIPLTIILLLASSCTLNIPFFEKEYSQNLPLAEVVFEAQVPSSFAPDYRLYIELLDDVSGFDLNRTRYEMQNREGNIYFVRIPLVIGSVVKYRYIIETANFAALEQLTSSEEVYFRMQYINHPKVVKDLITGWGENVYEGKTGELSGYIIDSSNNSPIPNVLLCINGMQTFSASDGSYLIKNIPEGQFNIVALHPNGSYQTFTQEAIIAMDATTPAIFDMHPSKYVTVQFDVKPPKNQIKGLPIRLVGNIHYLGNTFTKLPGNTSIVANRAPMLQIDNNGNYLLSIQLPAGFDLRYKYTLGDGFWNGELFSEGSNRTRQFIVPDEDTTIRNYILGWNDPDFEPINILVIVPSYTPVNDVISIQFNPYTWMPPIPMWKIDDTVWQYILYNPPELLDKTTFRICRNDQCGVADDITTAGNNSSGYSLSNTKNIEYSIENWKYLFTQNIPYDLTIENIPMRNSLFKAGIEIDHHYQLSWNPFYSQTIIDIGVNNGNWIILTPTWTVTGANSDTIRLNPSNDIMIFDLFEQVETIKQTDMGYAIYPILNLPSGDNFFWANVDKSYSWWHSWFAQYRNFILHFANLAAQTGAQSLIIGGNDLMPILQTDSYNVPTDMKEKMNSLIQDIRIRYSGEIVLAVPYSSYLPDLPQWAQQMDSYYVLYSTPLSSTESPTIDELTGRVAQIIDNELYAFYSKYQKPIIIGISYPSIEGSASLCVREQEFCEQPNSIVSVQRDYQPEPEISLIDQADLYLAFLRVISHRNWIHGFVSRGYYPPVKLTDFSSSIHGKPAEIIYGFWFSKMFQ